MADHTPDAAPDAGPDAGVDAFGLGPGQSCEQDGDCATGICWDFATVDPLCGGKACSWSCTTSGQCRALAQAAGAFEPERAVCQYNRCSIVNAGFSDSPFWCY